jgi:hypothetical protein
MQLIETIDAAFGWRTCPPEVVDPSAAITSELQEALWFANRDWHEITWADWETHRDAIYFFAPEAFRYFLPSVLTLSSESPEKWFWPVDSLLQVLDRSPVPEYWDDFILSKFIGLKITEYEAITQWLLLLSERRGPEEQLSIGRAFDTIALLKEATKT